jgi:NTE family protein
MTGFGLALGGGGSKGAFQIGAWQAFRELGLQFDAIAGTSIGAINGALMTSGDFDGAMQMWQNLQMDQCLEFTESQVLKSSDLLSLKNANILAREFLTQHRLNTRPLRVLLGQYIREHLIRQSPTEFGLMTALLPSLKPQPRWIADIPDMALVDYLMASAGLPGLQTIEIDGQRFIDGGVVDNVPISMLRDRGCRRIVAIDLGVHAMLRSPLLDNIELTYIHDGQSLGGALDIDPAVLNHNRRLGYLDTLKAFNRLSGDSYTFEHNEHRQLLQRFGAEILRGLEQAAGVYAIDRGTIYTAENFLDQIRQHRYEFEQIYQARRQSLKIEHKAAAILNGRLKVLNFLPPMRLTFLLDLSARAKQNGSLLKIPMQLFHSVDLAAQALLLLDG